MIKKNYLGFNSTLFIKQDKTMFNYTIDTVLLANFITLNSRVKRVIEVGTNNAALSILLAKRKSELNILALEIQERAYDLAIDNVSKNNLNNIITLLLIDFNDYVAKKFKEEDKFDALVCNPPYFETKTKIIGNISYEKQVAFYDIKLTLMQLASGARKILKQKGYLTVILPPDRLFDWYHALHTNNFQPKRVQFVYPRIYDQPILVLVEATYMSKPGCIYLNNQYLHNEDKDDHSYNEITQNLYKVGN
ncbi:tRNA1(Val) (adenine(37)-N6)-methyltransferase [Ureaplasma canigenitalium]|uniref:tRNA1(Val) (adenine(37)-N6)-methyltransferase n=1 Tax=Ureaplasma canigenitalium TaxID=42092 RepID=UPI0004E143A5|nr:methyltransferase [Ureaplasma canigenitalium]